MVALYYYYLSGLQDIHRTKVDVFKVISVRAGFEGIKGGICAQGQIFLYILYSDTK